ncbi:MAG: elongation factor P [Dehalococcoidia bacterium]|nr:elongation factor P [Dehalococcoidia bacterium]
MISTGEMKKGQTIELEGKLYTVVEYTLFKLGKGNSEARIRMKFRNVRSGEVIERSFHTDLRLPRANLERRTAQFLYSDGDLFHFMDSQSFEQFPLERLTLGDAVNYLSEGLSLQLVVHKEQPIGVELPINVDIKIAETGPAYRGDTASGGNKPATMVTGLVVQVPMFLDTGDTVRVDTRTGGYVERVSAG